MAGVMRNRSIMKIIVSIVLFIGCTWVYAGEWNEQITLYLDAYEKSAADPKPIVYPKLGERIKGLFLTNETNHILIKNQEKHQIKVVTELFYKSGELHILQHGVGWNMFTKGEYIYEWKTGEKTGFKIKRNEKDLVDYILYITDPSYIMTSLYDEYSRNPTNYIVLENKEENWKELSLKEPLYGFEAIYVNEEPLWFYGFRVTNPRSKTTSSLYIDKPIEYKRIPEELVEAMKKVEFSDSELTLRRHMVYL